MANSIKPYKGGYLLIIGNGKTQFWDLSMLKIMRECCNDIETKEEKDRRRFDF